jgi:hypothetical protein
MQTSDAMRYCSLDDNNGRGGETCRDEARNEAETMDRERWARDSLPIEKMLAFSEEKLCSRGRTARLGRYCVTNARSYWN